MVVSQYTSDPAENWELSKCLSTWGGNLISSMSCSGWAGNIPSRLRQKSKGPLYTSSVHRVQSPGKQYRPDRSTSEIYPPSYFNNLNKQRTPYRRRRTSMDDNGISICLPSKRKPEGDPEIILHNIYENPYVMNQPLKIMYISLDLMFIFFTFNS